MVDWSNVRNKIKDAFITIQQNPLANVLIKSALQSIPPPTVGSVLSNIYENATGALNDKSSAILQLLDNLQKMTENELEKISNSIEVNQEELIKNTQSLNELINITNSISNRLTDIETAQLKIVKLGSLTLQKINDSQDKIVNEFKITTDEFKNTMLSVETFDKRTPAENLRFYLRLQEYLQISNKIFLNQLAVRRQLETSLQNREEIREQISQLIDLYEGADDFLYQAHYLMNDKEKELFNFIKKTTKDLNQLNSYARYLLANNREFFIDMSELDILYEHLIPFTMILPSGCTPILNPP